MKRKTAICIVATGSFLKPLRVCLSRVRAAVRTSREQVDPTYILVTDSKSEAAIRAMALEQECFHVLALSVKEDGKHYDKDRQVMIARMQGTAFEKARELGCDYIWSVEADVLVPPNALEVSFQMLGFDNNYYGVAFVTYPSQGGGSFLGGHGSVQHPIEEDFLQHERKVPERLQRIFDLCKERLETKDQEPAVMEKEAARMQRLVKRIREKCPPKGNIFELQAKGWRRRGWLDNSHVGVGRGAVIQTDWTGLGCTLMGPEATALANFDGYDGGGTQDLFLNWHKWHPAGLRFCCITHTVCDHVVRDEKEGLVVLKAYHEPEGETKGHLRYVRRPFHEFI